MLGQLTRSVGWAAGSRHGTGGALAPYESMNPYRMSSYEGPHQVPYDASREGKNRKDDPL